MDRWELKPLQSIGDIRFGMSRDEVHGLFHCECKEFKKTKFSVNTTDDYGNFHVFYDADNKVEAVEIFEGIEVILNNTVVFPVETREILTRLPGTVQEEKYFTNIELSIGLEVTDENADNFLAGRAGYYE